MKLDFTILHKKGSWVSHLKYTSLLSRALKTTTDIHPTILHKFLSGAQKQCTPPTNLQVLHPSFKWEHTPGGSIQMKITVFRIWSSYVLLDQEIIQIHVEKTSVNQYIR